MLYLPVEVTQSVCSDGSVVGEETGRRAIVWPRSIGKVYTHCAKSTAYANFLKEYVLSLVPFFVFSNYIYKEINVLWFHGSSRAHGCLNWFQA